MRSAVRRLPLLVVAGFAVLASPVRAEEEPSRMVLCLAAAADGSPVLPIAEVPSNHKEIVLVWHLREGETAKKMVHVWTAVDVGAAAPAGTVIAKETMDLKEARYGVLRFTLPRDLPVGSYRLDVTVDETAWPPFPVRVGPPTTPTPLEKPADLLPLAVGTTWHYDLTAEGGPTVKNMTLPGTVKGEDGKLRGPATFVAAAADESGTRVEMRRGDVLANEEWWRLDASGLVVTKERQGKEEAVYDPPVTTIRLPLAGPTAWEHASKDGSFKRSVRMWGPLPLGEAARGAPGYVVLSAQPTGVGVMTIERWFVPGVGIVREVQVQSTGPVLLTRLEMTLLPEK